MGPPTDAGPHVTTRAYPRPNATKSCEQKATNAPPDVSPRQLHGLKRHKRPDATDSLETPSPTLSKDVVVAALHLGHGLDLGSGI
eukprot:2912943-Rhodomonas_salina.1